MKKFTKFSFLILTALILFSACSSKIAPIEPTPPTSESENNASSSLPQSPSNENPEEPDEEESPEYTNPLTGEEISADKVNSRPYAIMLNNIKQAMPQFGVSQADIIYELCAEGGITRMLGIYQDISTLGTVGSIRSARPYYIELALSHDAIYIHAGGSVQAYSDISSKSVTAFDGVNGGYEGTMFWRDKDRIANNGYEHSMMASGKTITEVVGDTVRTEHENDYVYEMNFDDDVKLDGGKNAEHIDVTFSSYKTSTFDYNADDNLYYFSQYGQPHIDAGNNQQVAVSNVIVLYAQQHVLDDAGRLSIDIVGSGEGMLFCGGKAVNITWSKENGKQFTYSTVDGLPIILERGRSYVCVINPGNDISFS